MKIEELVASPNIAKDLTDEKVQEIGRLCKDGYDADKQSRTPWEEWSAKSLKLALQVVEHKTFPWPNCFSLDTEILTATGWVPVANVIEGELVYSRAAGGDAGFYPVKSTVRHHSDEMVHFIGKSIDLLVTKNHRMVVESKTGKQSFVAAGDFVKGPTTNRYIPLTSKKAGNPIATKHGIPTEAYLRFLGWYVAEGSANYGENTYFHKKFGGFVSYGKTTSSFSIAQSKTANPEKCEIIKRDLEACGFTYKQNAESFTVHARSMPQSLKDELRAIGKCENKFLPRHIFDCSPSQLLELLDTLVLGDGTTTKKGHQSYFTTSKRLADDVQELCQYIGLRGTITAKEPTGKTAYSASGKAFTSKLVAYAVSINRKPLIQVAKLQRSIVPYNGDVACVNVEPHHTLYVRRNGKAVWVGNCSNVKFPLLTIAALAWHSKAYPALIQGDDVVKYKVIGKDPDNVKADRASRKGKYMSYKLLETSTWEEQTDKGLLVLAIQGTIFKKTVRDNNAKRNCSDLVMPQDLVVNYYTTDMESAVRVSHRFTLSKNEVREYVLQGLFLDVLTQTEVQPIGPLEAAKDKAQHLTTPQESTVFNLVEQSCWLDLDEDGYAEPYAVTFDEQTGKVVRILARYYKNDIKRVETGENKGAIYKIIPENYYTKFELIPSPDGGFYGIGFGLLLGPINESVNTALNQVFDAGTMKTLGGGFLGRGARIKGGEATFKPYEWKTVDSTGDNLRNNIVPLTVTDASPMLLELIKFLVSYGERVAGSGDIQMGELPGQNVKAGTAEIANENGRQIFDATWKRFWRAEKEEFKKLDRLESIFMQTSEGFTFAEKYYEVTREDFSEGSDGVCPVADPNITSKSEKRFMADMALADAVQFGGDVYEAMKRKYAAYGYSGFEQTFPDPKGPNAIPPAPNAEMEALKIKAMREETLRMQAENTFQLGQAELMVEAQLSQAKIDKIQAEILDMSDNSNHEETYKQVSLMQAQLSAEKLKMETLLGVAKLMMEKKKLEREPAKAA